LAALIDRDYRVLIPFGEGHAFDLAVYFDDATWLRIQCKTARPQRGCLVFNPHTTDHGRGRLSYVGLADIFGVYFPPRRSVYLVPIDAVTNFSGRLRLDPPRNNQRKGIRFAAEFEIDRWSPDSLRALVQSERRVEEALATVA
jgi:PD-(D/E)XK endonuclease